MPKAPKAPPRVDMKARSLEFLKDPNLWPRWPAVPVKRKSPEAEPWPQLGVVFEGPEGVRPIVYLGNLFDDKIEWGAAEKITYPSLEALVEDGWVVD